MSSVLNSVVEIGSFGLIDDVTGVEAAQKAAGKAAGVQAAGAARAEEGINRRFDITQENLRPFQQAGVSALEQQRILLGLGGSEQVDPNAERRAELEGQIASITQRQGSTGGGIASQVARQAFSEQNQSRLQDLQSQLSELPAFNPEQRGSAQEQQAQAFAAFNESPGQKFIRDRAQKNLLRNQSAIGGLGGGNVRSALVEQGTGFAQQDFQNQFGRLGQIAGQGQAATTNIGQFGAQAAQQAGQAGIAGSEARASGILGKAQAESQFTNSLLNLGGTIGGAFLGRAA